MRAFTVLAVIVGLAIAALYVGQPYVEFLREQAAPVPAAPAPPPPPSLLQGAGADSDAVAIHVFEVSAPAVALVISQTGVFRRSGGTGSGFLWDADGHVVTNYHVVENARQIGVRFGAGEVVPAEVTGLAPDYDLAVLRIRAERTLPAPIPVGSVGDLRVGQTVFAIGNPFGLSRTLTKGIISALDRTLPTAHLRKLVGVIQTDAAINPGNSGGPLLDAGGRLIGVNTAILSASGSSAGIGFAIPADIVARIVPQLIELGRVPQASVGIVPLDEEIAARVQVDGVVVAEITPGSPAAKAGIVGVNFRFGILGDVVTAVNGQPVRTGSEFVAAIDAIGIGGSARLTVARNGEQRSVDVDVVDLQ